MSDLKFPVLDLIKSQTTSSEQTQSSCYQTWMSGLSKLAEAQTVMNQAMMMSSQEALPIELKAQLSDLVSQVYSLQVSASEVMEELQEIDSGVPKKEVKKEEST